MSVFCPLKFVKRERGRDGKILGAHRQDGNVETHRGSSERVSKFHIMLFRKTSQAGTRTHDLACNTRITNL